MKEPGELAGLGFADGALSIEHGGGDAARSENRNQVALPEFRCSIRNFIMARGFIFHSGHTRRS
jgi:hypothetical protein